LISYGRGIVNKIGNSNSHLRIVDIIVEEEIDEFPVLDLKLKNIGNEIAFLKIIEFHVDEILEIQIPAFPRAIQSSWNYDVDLPLNGAPYVKPISISQAIEPNGIDRFTITVGNSKWHAENLNEYIYHMWFKIIYDEDDKEVRTSDIFIMTKFPQKVQGYVEISPSSDILYNNSKVMEKIYNINSIKGNRLKRYLEEWKNSKDEYESKSKKS
jgi:hypothetical protein